MTTCAEIFAPLGVSIVFVAIVRGSTSTRPVRVAVVQEPESLGRRADEVAPLPEDSQVRQRQQGLVDLDGGEVVVGGHERRERPVGIQALERRGVAGLPQDPRQPGGRQDEPDAAAPDAHEYVFANGGHDLLLDRGDLHADADVVRAASGNAWRF